MSDTPGTEPSRRIRLAVVFGGRSTEHAVSCVSAGSVLAAVDRDRYDVVPVGISREGRWVLAADEPDKLAIIGGIITSTATHPFFPLMDRNWAAMRAQEQALEAAQRDALALTARAVCSRR